MKKRSTLFYFVKEFSGTSFQKMNENSGNSSTGSDAESGFAPSASSIRKILDFAHSYDVLDSDSAGQIEIISN